MAKRNPKRGSKTLNHKEAKGVGPAQTTESPAAASVPSESGKAFREAVESIVIAIVLAFLFRAFEAEAFVIPTGSMAPTLQGRHKDLACTECGYRYQAGASLDAEAEQGQVVATKCPMCFYTQQINPQTRSHTSFTGDRILVNKFAYEPPFGEPKRWDVIVFKYPGNAKQNYIKRLVGLDNETVQLRHGDVFNYPEPNADRRPLSDFKIVRKPPKKLRHMLQLVSDTEHTSDTLTQLGWPLSWQPYQNQAWTANDQGDKYRCQAQSDGIAWLNYRHYYVDFRTWEMLAKQGGPSTEPMPVPITDFYAYNAQSRPVGRYFGHANSLGNHWVGDLAIEAEIEVETDSGVLWLDLIEAGRSHRCQIDVSTGQAKLSIDDPKVTFEDSQGNPVSQPTAETKLKGRGRYRLRFTNCDNQLLLWVNDRLCDFDQPTTYSPTLTDRPVTDGTDPGDLHPVRIGSEQLGLSVNRLRVLRDIYYIATKTNVSDYESAGDGPRLLTNPQLWRQGDLFDRRKTVRFSMEADQFFALGDNSPASKDSRLWGQEHYVEREMLIGKAVLIYWPHPWYGILPNFPDMGLIH